MPLGLERRGVLAELHRQERRDRMGPIGESDSSLQAAILGDFSPLRNSQRRWNWWSRFANDQTSAADAVEHWTETLLSTVGGRTCDGRSPST
jgi:hypothetical protein